jgi:hypothetical protein
MFLGPGSCPPAGIDGHPPLRLRGVRSPSITVALFRAGFTIALMHGLYAPNAPNLLAPEVASRRVACAIWSAVGRADGFRKNRILGQVHQENLLEPICKSFSTPPRRVVPQ